MTFYMLRLLFFEILEKLSPPTLALLFLPPPLPHPRNLPYTVNFSSTTITTMALDQPTDCARVCTILNNLLLLLSFSLSLLFS